MVETSETVIDSKGLGTNHQFYRVEVSTRRRNLNYKV